VPESVRPRRQSELCRGPTACVLSSATFLLSVSFARQSDEMRMGMGLVALIPSLRHAVTPYPPLEPNSFPLRYRHRNSDLHHRRSSGQSAVGKRQAAVGKRQPATSRRGRRSAYTNARGPVQPLAPPQPSTSNLDRVGLVNYGFMISNFKKACLPT